MIQVFYAELFLDLRQCIVADSDLPQICAEGDVRSHRLPGEKAVVLEHESDVFRRAFDDRSLEGYGPLRTAAAVLRP